MANSQTNADWVALDCLELLTSKLGISNYFNREYSKEFQHQFPVSDSIRVPYPAQFNIRNGLTYNPQDIVRRYATIEFDEPFGVDFEWDSAEAALRMPRGKERVRKEINDPAMAKLAAEIDSRSALYAYQHAANSTGTYAVNPTTYDATSAAARQIMEEYGCPESGDRALIVPPAVMRAVKGANLALFNPVADIAKQFRRGIIGHSDGFDWFQSMSLHRHTTGTAAALTTVSVAPTDGATSLVIAGAAGLTFRKGDKFTFALARPVHPMTKRTFAPAATLKQFTVTADFTMPVAGTGTLSFSPAIYGPNSPYQNVNVLPLAGAALTGAAAGINGIAGLAIHENAFAMVGATLEEPKGSSVELVSQKRDPDSGISIRFIRQWDSRASKFINRFDCMIGYGTLYNDSGAVVICCG